MKIKQPFKRKNFLAINLGFTAIITLATPTSHAKTVNAHTIDQSYQQCMRHSVAADSAVSCQTSAYQAYEKLFASLPIKDEKFKLQYKSVSKACELPYSDGRTTLSSNEETYIYACKLNTAKSFYREGINIVKNQN